MHNDTLETFAAMLSGEYNTDRLKKIITYIDETAEKLQKLKTIALNRIIKGGKDETSNDKSS